MTVRAVLVTGFATGRFRVGLGRTFAERRGLTLTGANDLLELPLQLGVLRFESGDAFEKFPTTGTRGFVHAAIIATTESISCASLPRWGR